MNNYLRLSLTLAIALLSTIVRAEPVTTAHKVHKDVPYGEHPQQVMDIYLLAEQPCGPAMRHTVVFLHGGGYSFSDKSKEERYIYPYLQKGFNVINLNYRLKTGVPAATDDLVTALNFLHETNDDHRLNLSAVILTGFSAGAHIASNVGAAQNNEPNPFPVSGDIGIAAVIHFAGSMNSFDLIEKMFIDGEPDWSKEVGNNFFPDISGYTPKEIISVYEPMTYFDDNDPAYFIWHGGKDDQIPPHTYGTYYRFIESANRNDKVLFKEEAGHSPTEEEFNEAYRHIFMFIDQLEASE